MVTEAKRQKLFTLLEGTIGPEGADIFMEIVDPLASTELATKSDIAHLRTELHTDIADLRAELHTDIAGLRTDIADLRVELRTETAAVRNDMADLRVDIAAMKGDLTRTLAGWIFLSQGVTAAVVGLLISLG